MKKTAIVIFLFIFTIQAFGFEPSDIVLVDDFQRADSLYHGNGWETLNPGYWRIENGTLCRRLRNRGDWTQNLQFPFRSLLKKDPYSLDPAEEVQSLPRDYPPSLPFGMLWKRDWDLRGNYTIRFEAKVIALAPSQAETEKSKEYEAGYSLMGICFGGRSLLESWKGGASEGANAAWMAVWRGDGKFGVYTHATDGPATAQRNSEKSSFKLKAGDNVSIQLAVTGQSEKECTVIATLYAHSSSTVVKCENVDREKFADGYFGVVGRGLLDFAVQKVTLFPFRNQQVEAAVNDLRVCYPLGDTLEEKDGKWHCRFIGMFRSDGEVAEVRVADSPDPKGGWGKVPVAGRAKIISNHFRLNTASIDVELPFNPGLTSMYYTVWKDGVDVTGDPREGFLGKKDYVGRLPKLAAPYRIAGLGGHSISGPADMEGIEKFEKNWVRGQPTADAFKYFEDFNFQICDWEDDVWYLEHLIFTTSIDDAYKIINITIANPTTRWMMMRHWNTINPGDHDYGMNDLRGPEQYVIRKHGDLGQDPEYMRRNYQIVQHLISGDEDPSGTENAKYWRKWKMPNGDFTFLILDARSWRDSTDTALWVRYGWEHNETVYDRTAPMRTLLGEEQFAWLSEVIKTDSSDMICVTGLNALHTVWQGSGSFEPDTGLNFNQRGRGAGDYAGWAKAGSDRVIELLGSRPGIVTVYGDVHCASIMKNMRHRLFECSFGAIARSGARGIKKGFGPLMSDYDLRPLEMFALYHSRYGSADLEPRKGPTHWNFLEASFDTRSKDAEFELKIRNVIDSVKDEVRGGGSVLENASNTGRPLTCKLPKIETLADATVLFSTADHKPIRGARSDSAGRLAVSGLTEIDGKDVKEGTPILVTAFDGEKSDVQLVYAEPIDEKELAVFREKISQFEKEEKKRRQGWIDEYRAGKRKN